MTKQLSTLACLLLTYLLHAQQTDFENYQPLKSSGNLPKEVTTSSSSKYKKDVEKISDKTSGREKGNTKRFYLESNFVIDDMLRNGTVLYNDPLGQYVNDVADKLLESNPELRKKLNFYVLRSSSVNAFATSQGVVLVTVGMLSQIENEAQLAFVLAHEITHYRKKHTLDMYLEVDRINKGSSRSTIFNQTKLDKNLLKNTYSRKLELEADKEGFELMLKSGYDLASLEGTFDVLAYGHLPFEERKFTPSFFESEYLKFPESHTRKEIRPIELEEEDDDDAESTHPNFHTRRTTLQEGLKNSPNATGKRSLYLLSQERFVAIQKIARFEVPLLSLHQESFYRGIYEAWLSMEQHPNSLYLRKTLLKGMYISAKYRNNNNTYIVPIDSIQGELQGLVHFMETISEADLNTLVVTEAWKLYKDMPNDTEVKNMLEDALKELFVHHYKDLSGFSTEKPTPEMLGLLQSTVTDTTKTETTEKEEEEEESKKGTSKKMQQVRKKKKKEEEEKKAVEGIMKYALAPYLGDNNFQELAKKQIAAAEKRKEQIAYYKSYEGRSKRRSEERRELKNGKRLNIDKMVVVNPIYLNIDERGGRGVQFIESEASQAKFNDILADNAKKVGLKLSILDAEKFKAGDTDKYNDLALLNQWMSEQVDFENLSITPGFRQAEIDAIARKYGTKYFCWTGVIARHEAKSLVPALGVCLGPFAWPFVAAYYVRPEYESLYFNIVYNVETGGFDMVKLENLDHKDNTMLLNMHTYDALLQIKSK
jgi:beta-barrel assembly-enhancing protease